jgi:uncharacterized membrane protein
MKVKTFLFLVCGLCTLVLLASLGSAVVHYNNMSGEETTQLSATASPNTEATIIFTLFNEHTENATDIAISLPALTNGAYTIPASRLTLANKPSIVGAQSESNPITLTINVPSDTRGGTYTGLLHGTGMYVGPISFDSVITLEVNSVRTLQIVKVQELTKDHEGIIDITNRGNVKIQNIALSSSGAFSVFFSQTTNFDLDVGQTKRITVTSADLNDLEFGNNVVTITAAGVDGTTQVSGQTTFTIKEGFCKSGEQGNNLSIEDVDIDNQGEGKDSVWNLLDVIEVTVNVENNGDDEVKDVIVELGLFDSNGKNVIDDLEFLNNGGDDEQVDLGDLNDGDDDTATFRFKVSPDMDDGSYNLAIKAYGDDEGESNECTTEFDGKLFEEIDIERETDEERYIAFDNIIISPSDATCGDSMTIKADVYNIGDEDQDQVQVILLNSELNIEKTVEIRNDLDMGDKETVTFELVIPEGLRNKVYDLSLTAKYDYRNGEYRQSLESPTLIPLSIIGCSGSGESPGEGNIVINAALESDAQAGKELVIRSTITNLGSETATFIVGANDYESWATLDEVSERMFDLGPGDSKDVTLTFTVKEDAAETESFVIEARAADQVETREVEVNIKKASTGFPNLGLGDNALIWVIGIINVILIILIIIVAVKISRR